MGIVDSPIINRVAQLRITQKIRGLDQVQQKELDLCLDWIVNHCWRQAHLRNLSLMASMTNDIDWQHEICRDIDERSNR